MRSTRVSAAWAGIALATSFLSVTITGMQPHTASRVIAESVAMTSLPVNAFGSANSPRASKQADAAESSTTAGTAR